MLRQRTPKTNVKKQRSSSFYILKRRITHPTQLPAYLGMLWGLLAILIVPPIITELKLSVEYFLIIFIPPLFLFGLCGYFMVQRNQFIDRHGNIIHEFPAKPYGYLIMIFYWGLGILFIATFIFRW
jgi:hypothetical protein